MNRFISPSILAADFLHLGDEVEKINNSSASWIHCDIMDGVFVPNISFGLPVVEKIKKVSRKPLDVHLMITDPDKYIDGFCKLGIDILTVHQEACKDVKNAIRQIKQNGVKAGMTVSPDTPVSVLSGVIADLDLVLVMSVYPGFGGQSFIENTYGKIRELKEMIHKSNSKALIQVDGGITLDNALQLFDSGVNILVTGTTVFHSDDPAKTVDALLNV
jgi:ribulose-phosphate 3-epimerase